MLTQVYDFMNPHLCAMILPVIKERKGEYNWFIEWYQFYMPCSVAD